MACSLSLPHSTIRILFCCLKIAANNGCFQLSIHFSSVVILLLMTNLEMHFLDSMWFFHFAMLNWIRWNERKRTCNFTALTWSRMLGKTTKVILWAAFDAYANVLFFFSGRIKDSWWNDVTTLSTLNFFLQFIQTNYHFVYSIINFKMCDVEFLIEYREQVARIMKLISTTKTSIFHSMLRKGA